APGIPGTNDSCHAATANAFQIDRAVRRGLSHARAGFLAGHILRPHGAFCDLGAAGALFGAGRGAHHRRALPRALVDQLGSLGGSACAAVLSVAQAGKRNFAGITQLRAYAATSVVDSCARNSAGMPKKAAVKIKSPAN